MKYELTHDSIARQVFEKAGVEARRRREVEAFVRKAFVRSTAMGEGKGLLGKDDLDYVQPFLPAIRLEEAERQFVQESQDAVKRQERWRRQIRRTINALLVIALIFGIVASLFYWQSEKSKRRALSTAKANQALLELKEDPTRSIDDAIEAWELDRSDLAYSTLLKIYYHQVFEFDEQTYANPFYNNYFEYPSQFYRATITGDDDKTLVAALDSHVYVLSIKDGKTAAEPLSFPYQRVRYSIPLRPGSDTLLTLAGQQVFVHDYEGNIFLRIPEIPERKLNHFAVAPQKRFLALGGDRLGNATTPIRIYDLSGSYIASLEGHRGDITSVVFSPGKEILATASGDSTLCLWKVQSKEEITLVWKKTLESSPVTLVFSDDGSTLFAGMEDGSIDKWDLRGNLDTAFQCPGHPDKVTALAFYHSYLAGAGADKQIRLWDNLGRELIILKGHQDEINSLEFSSNGEFLQSASFDGTVKRWHLKGLPVATFSAHRGDVLYADWSSGGNHIATASKDSSSLIWNVSKQRVIQSLPHEGKVYFVKFLPEEQGLITGSNDQTVRRWNLDGTEAWRTQNKRRQHTLALSPGGAELASAGYQFLRFYNVENGQLTDSLEVGELFPALEYLDHKVILCATKASKLLKINRATGHIDTFHTDFDGVTDLVLSNDKTKLFICGREDKVFIWDVVNNKKEALDIPGFKMEVRSMDYMKMHGIPTLATADYEGYWHLWSTENGVDMIGITNPGRDKLSAVRFSPQGDYLLTSQFDNTARIWLVEPDSLIRRLKIKD